MAYIVMILILLVLMLSALAKHEPHGITKYDIKMIVGTICIIIICAILVFLTFIVLIHLV